MNPLPTTASDGDAGKTARPILIEVAIVFTVASSLCAGAFQVSRAVPFLARNLHVVIAAIFLYLPALVLFRQRRDLASYGFTLRPLGASLLLAFGAMLVFFPPFALATRLWETAVCAPRSPLAPLAMAGECTAALLHRALPFATRLHGATPLGAIKTALAELVVVALPEELFFRGYLLGRLEEALPPRRRLLGGGVGLALVLQAALFALAHVAVDLDPRRLAVFFPGLVFGWMRSRTRSITAGTTFHAACNLFERLL